MELYEYQKKAKEIIDSTDHNLVVVTATGSGKTKCGEFAIEKSIRNNKKAIYTTPLKALSNQKFKDFTKKYADKKVGLLTGDYSINKDGDIVLMTAEVLRNMLVSDQTYLDDVEYIVLDEFHYLNDRERGTVWEEIIMYAPLHCTIICLSATFPNYKDMCDWMEATHKKTEVITSDVRPVPLTYYYYSNNSLKEIKDGRNINSCLNEFDINNLIRKLDAEHMLPCIYFSFNRDNCHELADEIMVELLDKQQVKEVRDIVTNFCVDHPFFKNSPIKRLLLKGIGIHHAGMLPQVKELIESIYLKGYIKIVFATETLSAGINIPAKTTILSSMEKYDGIEKRYLTISEFRQMAGRAGRKGYDDKGNVIIVGNNKYVTSLILGYVTAEPDKVKSNFHFNYNTLANILSYKDLDAINDTIDNTFMSYTESLISNENFCDKMTDSKFKKYINYNQALIKLQDKYSNHIVSEKEYKRKKETLRNKLKNFSCHKCANIANHIAYIEDNNKPSEVEQLKQNTKNRLTVLKRYRYVDNNNLLTENGLILREINDNNELFILELLRSGILDKLDSRQLVCLLTCIATDVRKSITVNAKYKSKNKVDIKEALTATRKLIKEINSIESINDIQSNLDLDKTFVNLADEWVCGTDWNVLYNKGLSERNEGEFFRIMHRVINILKQYRKVYALIPNYLSQKLQVTIETALLYIDRDIMEEV